MTEQYMEVKTTVHIDVLNNLLNKLNKYAKELQENKSNQQNAITFDWTGETDDIKLNLMSGELNGIATAIRELKNIIPPTKEQLISRAKAETRRKKLRIKILTTELESLKKEGK